MDTTANFEADKARIARAILNIDNNEMLEKVKYSLSKVFEWKSKATPVDLTARMIEKFSGAWIDNRTAEEIVDDIYSSRYSAGNHTLNPFDE